MKSRYFAKTGIILGGLVLTGMIGTGASLFYLWYTVRVMTQSISTAATNMLSVSDLSAALLRQRGYVASFILDSGDGHWLQEEDALEPKFRRLLEELESRATADEWELLKRTRAAFERYDSERDRVVALYRKGNVQEATEGYLGPLTLAYRDATLACDALVATHRRAIDETLEHRKEGTIRLTILVAVAGAFMLLFGLALIAFLRSDVFAPLQRITDDIRSSPGTSGNGDLLPQPDDLTALGVYVRTLMSEVLASRTEAERSRRDLQHSERLAALGKAVAHLAHEIKNALGPIGGFARLIEKRPSDTKQVREGARIIFSTSMRLERMISEVLHYSRPGLQQLQLQSVNSVVQEALSSLRPHIPENVSLNAELDPATPKVPFPPGAVEQIILNLVGNAADAVGPSGSIRVETHPHPSGAQIVVSDDGPGIAPEIQRQVFEPFFTTKNRGSGLGLAICRQIVSDLGGGIEVRSEPGKGAVFTITLASRQATSGRA